MDVIWNRYYGLIEKLLHFTGMWPCLKPRTRYLRIGLMTTTIITIFISQVACQVKCGGSVECIVTSVTAFAFTFASIVTLYTFPINISKIKRLTENLFTDWKQLKRPEEMKILESYAKNCKRFSQLFSAYCYLGTCIFLSTSLVRPALDVLLPLNKSRPLILPYPGYFFVDSRKYLIYIYGYSIVSNTIAITSLVAHDCIFVTYIEHICCMYAVLGFRFKYLFGNRDNLEKNRDVRSEESYCKRIAREVRVHRNTLEFVKLIESTFTVPFAAQLIVLVTSISCTLLQITKQDAEVLEMIRYVLLVAGQLFHVFCLSYEGQKLIDHSIRMREQIYESIWYEAPMKSQRMLIVTMIQSFRPTFLSAGKIYTFSLENFTTIIQTSMSYFTVLASFQ